MNEKMELEEAEQCFPVGEIVSLNSGGPLMTVASVFMPIGTNTVYVSCIWHNDITGEYNTKNFLPEVLLPLGEGENYADYVNGVNHVD